ncbi:MAG: hypothetical protein ACK47B_07625 [Armatimonadota bacterium]
MATLKLFRKVRETLVTWGWVPRRSFGMRRHPAGVVRSRLARRGSSRRFRHVPLKRLLRL